MNETMNESGLSKKCFPLFIKNGVSAYPLLVSPFWPNIEIKLGVPTVFRINKSQNGCLLSTPLRGFRLDIIEREISGSPVHLILYTRRGGSQDLYPIPQIYNLLMSFSKILWEKMIQESYYIPRDFHFFMQNHHDKDKFNRGVLKKNNPRVLYFYISHQVHSPPL